jgi:aryl-alcohol dehydrogenase-like predicted oxidoreductase
METRDLGNTGMKISRIVFGCGAVGGVIFKAEMAESVEAVRRALLHGVNWFDTAASYGDGQSEERLAAVLEELGATPYVSTKVALKEDELSDIPGSVRRSLERSLKRLKRDRVDLFQLHNAVTIERGGWRNSISVDDVLGQHGAAAAFDQLRSEGVIGAAGFTANGNPDALKQMIASGSFQTLQAYFNMLNPSAVMEVPKGFGAQDFGKLVPYAREHGLGVLNIRVLAAGALAGRVMDEESPGIVRGAEGRAENLRVRRVCEELGVDPEKLYSLALRFAFMRPEIDGVLIGFSTPDHVDEAVSVLAEPPLPDETVRRIEAIYASSPFAR